MAVTMNDMKRVVGGFLAWVALAVGMSGVAWQAVSLAGAQVSETPDQPVVAAPRADPPPPVPGSSAADPPGGSTITSQTTTTLPLEDPTGPSTTVTTSDSPTATSPTTATTTSTTAATTTSSSTSTTATVAASGQWEVSTWTLVGGTVTIRSRPGEVELVSAVPSAGFSSTVEDAGLDRVRVDFDSSDHESEFEAKWEGGVLDVTREES